jgi:hypothetical protein
VRANPLAVFLFSVSTAVMSEKKEVSKIVGKINLEQAKKRPTKVTPLKVPMGELAGLKLGNKK